MPKVSPLNAIRVMQMTHDEMYLTKDQDLIRAHDEMLSYNLMWSPPYFRTPDEKPNQRLYTTMRRLAADNVVALIHKKALGELDPEPGSHARLVALVPPEVAKPLAKMGCTCIGAPPGPEGSTNRFSYPLEVGHLEVFGGYQFVHNGKPYHIDVAYQYNRDIQDVDAGIQYLERNERQRDYWREQ